MKGHHYCMKRAPTGTASNPTETTTSLCGPVCAAADKARALKPNCKLCKTMCKACKEEFNFLANVTDDGLIQSQCLGYDAIAGSGCRPWTPEMTKKLIWQVHHNNYTSVLSYREQRTHNYKQKKKNTVYTQHSYNAQRTTHATLSPLRLQPHFRPHPGGYAQESRKMTDAFADEMPKFVRSTCGVKHIINPYGFTKALVARAQAALFELDPAFLVRAGVLVVVIITRMSANNDNAMLGLV